jgi:hypothetical protein
MIEIHTHPKTWETLFAFDGIYKEHGFPHEKFNAVSPIINALCETVKNTWLSAYAWTD